MAVSRPALTSAYTVASRLRMSGLFWGQPNPTCGAFWPHFTVTMPVSGTFSFAKQYQRSSGLTLWVEALVRRWGPETQGAVSPLAHMAHQRSQYPCSSHTPAGRKCRPFERHMLSSALPARLLGRERAGTAVSAPGRNDPSRMSRAASSRHELILLHHTTVRVR